MYLSELDYDLPEELIAQRPSERRDDARMLLLDRKSGALEHSRFYKLAQHLRDGDLVVLNDTRVLPARLLAKKESGGRVELLLVRPSEEYPEAWLAMLRAHRRLKEGTRLILDDGSALTIAGYSRPRRPLVVSEDSVSIDQILRTRGKLALPHYIRRDADRADFDDYQTVYAEHPGAIAAPTAGLHFTDTVFRELSAAGVRIARITLHIGPGTFAPVRAPAVEGHAMEAEWFTISPATVAALEHARRIGGRVIAVGTSTTRALESYAITGDAEGFTGLFIYPGFRFKLVDAMITNFHVPRSTVLALVMAFAGRDAILDAYREAIRRKYRFLSYGDAMLII